MVALNLAPRDVVAKQVDGAWYLSSPLPLGTPAARLGDLLRRAAEHAPDRVFLMERQGDELRRLTYREALRAAEGVADWLVSTRAPDATVVALSGNSIDHALLMLGCFFAGVPFAPVSPAYSLLSKDFIKLRAVVDKLKPSVVYVESQAPFARALNDLGLDGSKLDGPSLRELYTREPGAAMREREASITPDHVAKILFTSGSTGSPKGVPNTHRMLCSNQQMIAQLWPFLDELAAKGEPPMIVDWLPWSHTFGGNHNFNLVLAHAGTLLVDEGKPAPGLIDASIKNLRALPPTLYFNVPAGFAALLPRLEADEELCRTFFSRLRVVFYAGAALPPDLWARVTKLATRSGASIFMTTAWGSTETSPLATSMFFEEKTAGNIGLPAPGVTLKLVPNGKKLEIRVKGPHVTTGYWNEPELTRAVFDDEGFYKTGDAVRFARSNEDGTPDPSGGLMFDGRVTEDFKLSTGTWVSVSTVRTGVVARANGLVSDVVVCGHDRGEVTLLAWPGAFACHALIGEELSVPEICVHPQVRRRLRDRIALWNNDNPGSSTRIARVLILEEPPCIDAGEITDKGYTNQAATIERRAADVARLQADPPSEDVIVI
jgi:feruloyl-CoA synthase